MKTKIWHPKLLKIFNSVVRLTKEDEEALLRHWKHSDKLRRNEFLVKKGEIEANLFYVVDGCMRIYFPHRAEEVCVGFAYDDSLICSYPSFIQQRPSDYAIQALRSTKVVSIRRSDFYKLFDNHPMIERAWRLLEEHALVGKIDREAELLTFTPEERFHRLVKRSPHLLRIVPKKYIASYLRMSAETLSRIRLR